MGVSGFNLQDSARASTDIRYPDRDHDHERNQDPDRDDEYSERNEDFIRDYDFDFDYDYDHYYVEDFGNIDEEEDPSHLQTSPRVINPLDYPDDESYSRALQIALDENLARNMMSLSIAQRSEIYGFQSFLLLDFLSLLAFSHEYSLFISTGSVLSTKFA